MNPVRRVVVLGSLNLDLVAEVGRLPVPGETVLGSAFRSAGGGKGANQAVAAARVGAQVTLIGCVGEDANGRQLQTLLREDAVDISRVRVVAEPTGVALILVEAGGQNVIAVVPGANGCLRASDVAEARPALVGADVLVAQLEVPLAAVSAGAAAAREAGVAFMLNAAPARTGLDQLLRDVDVLVVNETELGSLAGRAVAVGDEAAVARMLVDRGVRAVVVTLGGRGALVVDARGVTPVAAWPIEAVDTTAAGDAFTGALAARYAGPESLVAAARYASAAAALACTGVGAQPSLPRAVDVEHL
ncbi:MAG: ribokinase, partial [Chloroflexi bacterium]|nr:ribokinase [Chloroflexota bacterium]